MRDARLKFWWLRLNTITGFEGEGEGDGGNAGDEGNAGSEGNNEDSGGEGSDESHDSNLGDKEDVTGLKSALAKERAERQRLEKENKAFNKAKKEREDAELTEIERLKKEDEAKAEKVARLATKFRTSAVEKAIREAASNFISPEDAVLALKGDPSITVEQDEDDPSEVKVDEKAVKAAVAQLAKEKSHWVKAAAPKSGSKFGGTGDKPSEKDELASRYPALQGRMSR